MPPPLSATDRAYQETRTKIIEGGYPDGAVITEGQVAATLGISRTPVREAFLKLQAEGMLQLYPKRGAVVVPVAAEEAFPVMEAREVVEAFAITKLLTEHKQAPEALITSLWEIISQMAKQIRARDTRHFQDLDGQFHLTIVSAGQNPFFDQLSVSLRQRQRRLQGALSGPRIHERMERSHREHVALLETIERGDLDLALSQLRAHLRAGRAMITGPSAARVG